MPISLIRTGPQFDEWLANAAPGDRCVYARAAHIAGALVEVASAARYAHDAGMVALFQRRQFDPPDRFEYSAVRVSPDTVGRLSAISQAAAIKDGERARDTMRAAGDPRVSA